MKKITWFFGLVVVFVLAMPIAQGAEFIAPTKEDGGTLILSKDTLHNNAYIMGANVSIASATAGDLYVAGGNVTVYGDVEQDIMASAGTLALHGKIGGDVRAMGGNITLGSQVYGDALIAGGSVIIPDTARIGGDAIIAGGSIIINAPVHGLLRVTGGSIVIDSQIDGDVTVRAQKSLVFGPHANISGHITYYGKQVAVVKDGAKITAIDKQVLRPGQGFRVGMKALAGGAMAIKLVGWIIAGLLLLYFMRNQVQKIVVSASHNPWPYIGTGLAGIIFIPITIVMLFLTLVGYYVAIIVAIWFILALLMACLMSSALLGAYIIKVLMRKPGLVIDWQAVLIGAAAMIALSLVPIVGWILELLLFLMVFGSILRMVKKIVLAKE